MKKTRTLTTKICDRCGKEEEGDPRFRNFVLTGEIKYSYGIMDYQGAITAGVSKDWDLCDECTRSLDHWLAQREI